MKDEHIGKFISKLMKQQKNEYNGTPVSAVVHCSSGNYTYIGGTVEQVNNFNQPVQQTQSFEFNKPAQTFEINNQPAFDGGFVNELSS